VAASAVRGPVPRHSLLALLRRALESVDGRRVVRAALGEHPSPRRSRAFAVGKAAAAMWLGARDALADALEGGLVITIAGNCSLLEAARAAGAEVLVAAHPLPDARSLAAGQRLLDGLATLPAEVEPLLLISGGASSLAEVPRAGVTLDALREVAEQGLATGVPIAELNRRRAALSALKGGSLTRALGGRSALALFVSDVPGDDPGVIGSGLLAPVPGDRIERRIVATLADALHAVATGAAAETPLAALKVRVDPDRLCGEAGTAGEDLARMLCAAPPGLYVLGGETTVSLPAAPGRGGRNQHLALAAARLLSGRDGVALLACGTDGIDGASDDAGAIVDGGTWQRILDAGIDPARALERADAGTALEAAGDLVHTGPTGTNVGDIVICLKLC
jgi:hydroxypyruvate reductase